MKKSENDSSHKSLNSQIERPSDDIYYGLASEVVAAIDPHTEADPIAILTQFLCIFGNLIGRRPHFMAGDDYHALNLFVVLVGNSSKGRKGSSLSSVMRIFKEIVNKEYIDSNFISGLSTGEGLIWRLKDEEEMDEPNKKVVVIEPELATVLRNSQRQGNILSQILRQAWDGAILQKLTKTDPVKATGHHISIIGHITRDELLRQLNSTEMANGFGNRFIWLWVKRSKLLPNAGRIPDDVIKDLSDKVASALDFANSVGEMKRSQDANELWIKEYEELSKEILGLVGSMLARAEAQVMRIACIYALLDCSEVVKTLHLKAALDLWRYCENSVFYVFQNKLGDPIADKVLELLMEKGEQGLTTTELHRAFANHVDKTKLERALDFLLSVKRVRYEEVKGAGRSGRRWFINAN